MHKGIKFVLGAAALAGTFEAGHHMGDKVHSPDFDPRVAGELAEACGNIRDEAAREMLGSSNMQRIFMDEGSTGESFAEIEASMAVPRRVHAACMDTDAPTPTTPAPTTPPTPPTTPGS